MGLISPSEIVFYRPEDKFLIPSNFCSKKSRKEVQSEKKHGTPPNSQKYQNYVFAFAITHKIFVNSSEIRKISVISKSAREKSSQDISKVLKVMK